MIKKRDWLYSFGLVFSVWLVDQITKVWAIKSLDNLEFLGPLGLVLHRNPGAMLGVFSDLPPILRIVCLSTGGAFLIFIYLAIQWLLPNRSLILRVGMSVLLGGILGNVTDRILYGSVIDFIILSAYGKMTPAFNIADAVQWIGYIMVVYALITEGEKIWPNTNERKSIWILPKFQLKYCLLLVAIGLCFSIITGVFSFTFLKVTIEDLAIGRSKFIEHKFLTPFLITFFIISTTFLIMLFQIGRILSHRTAGPIYAFEKFLEDILKGKDRPLRLRAGDELTHLEEIANKIREQLKKNISIDNPPPTDTPKPTEPI